MEDEELDIDLAKFAVDVDDALEDIELLLVHIDQLKQSQKELEAIGRKGNRAYIEQAGIIKALQKQYNGLVNAVRDQYLTTADAQVDREQLITLQLRKQAETIEDAKKQNRELTELRNTANASTAEGRIEIGLLNDKMNENKELIKEVSSATRERADAGQTELEVAAKIQEALAEQVFSIREAKEQNKELKNIREQVNATTAVGQEQLAKLNTRINENTDFIKLNVRAKQSQAETAEQLASREERIAEVLNRQIRSIQDARDQNKSLNILRNTANLQTAQGREELAKLNSQLDKNNEFIRANVDQYTQQKINVGNYTESIKQAFEDINVFNGGLGAFIARANEAGGVTALLTNAFVALKAGIISATRAALAFIATGIGAIIAVAAAGFLLVQNAVNRSEESANKLSVAFSSLGSIIDSVLKFLEPLGELLIDGIVKGLELAEKAVLSLIKNWAVILDFVGFEKQAEQLIGLAVEMENAIATGKRMTEMQLELAQAERQVQVANAESAVAAEKLRQKMRDQNLTIQERIQANNELSANLEEQIQREQRVAEMRLQLNLDQQESQGQTNDLLNEEAQIRAELLGFTLKINRQQTRSLQARNRLLNKAAQIESQRLKQAADIADKELELFLQTQGTKAKSMEQELDIARQVRDKKLEIAEKEFEATEKTEADKLALTIARNAAEIELEETKVQITLANAEREFEIFKSNLDRQINEHGRFTDDWLALERQRSQDLLTEQARLAQERLLAGEINEQQYQDRIAELRAERDVRDAEAEEENRILKREQQLERQAAEFELEMIRQQEEGVALAELERQRVNEQERVALQELQNRYQNELISKENFEAQKALIEAEAAAFREEIKRREEEAKLSITANSLGQIANIIGKHSTAGKALAIAQALINTYQGITAALAAPWPASIPATIAAAATGFKAVKDIMSTQLPNEFGGGSGTGGSGGNLGSSVRNFTGRGVNLTGVAASGNAAVQQDIEQSAINANLVTDIANAVREGAESGTETGSTRGITNLSENRDIQAASSF